MFHGLRNLIRKSILWGGEYCSRCCSYAVGTSGRVEFLTHGRLQEQQHEGGRGLSCLWIQEADFGPQRSLAGQIHIECLLPSCSVEPLKGRCESRKGMDGNINSLPLGACGLHGLKGDPKPLRKVVRESRKAILFSAPYLSG